MTIAIPLTQGKITFIDDDDYDMLMEINTKWFAHWSRNYYAETKVKGRIVKMHRVIISAPVGLEVDHIDRNSLNNRRTNLRLVTQAENMLNKSIYTNNNSGVTGVYYFKAARGLKHWHAQITRGGVQRSLGNFLTKEEAISARLEAENDLNT